MPHTSGPVVQETLPYWPSQYHLTSIHHIPQRSWTKRRGNSRSAYAPMTGRMPYSPPNKKPFQCPHCSSSFYIGALCQDHIATSHSKQLKDNTSSWLPLAPLNTANNACVLMPVAPAPTLPPPSSPPAPTSPPSTTSTSNPISAEPASDAENDTCPGTNKMLVCRYKGCGYATNSKIFLQRHLTYVHERGKKYQCARCSMVTWDSVEYKSHLMNHLGLS